MLRTDTQQGSRRFLKSLNLQSSEEAYREVKKLVSELTDDEHAIRSSILDLHAGVEFELRRFYYHHLSSLLFQGDSKTKNAQTQQALSKAIHGLGFSELYRVLKPVLKSWPYPDLDAIPEINRTRTKAAHSSDTTKVLYKGRSPFKDADCFAQMYFDAWSISQSLAKIFEWTIEIPRWKLREYRKRFGDL